MRGDGGKRHQVTRHLLGLSAGRPSARGWRRVLSEHAARGCAGPEGVKAARGRIEVA
ncbi:hypothetical protein [Salipiger thiooxidans]|uniref:hypothetical protein n=1 Tax=Salipiger thiooxidans TaxID=282683 RepID=UPI001F61BCDF|nr:hypothetical protein [Salipiger thiooxidans]